MALNWFKKKKGAQEEPVDAEQETDESFNNTPETESNTEVRPMESGETAESQNFDNEIFTSSGIEARDIDCEVPEQTTGFFKRLKNGLSKTRKLLSTDINDLFAGKGKIDNQLLEELEERLITSDLGVQTTLDLIQSVSGKSSKISGPDQLKEVLKEKILELLGSTITPPQHAADKPHVIMVIGVNGTGKTTTIGKLAAKFSATGNKVIVVAADTFRAAAIEQLAIWAERAGVEIIKHKEMSDPAAVAYDGIEAAVARNADIVLVDTAGRLHTKKNLMEELKKIKRTISKKIPGAPHEILLTLDATTGQNALAQAQLFNDALEVTGIALTKLDGTAKGGIAVSICSTLEIPLSYIGIGEKIEDLQEFNPVEFVNALF
ncbi:MAG: signal recognition particle-docking protein FtsY [Desulfobacterales bacterium]|jgi:fused signal recognition particle receptor|nr:signal recognition particle-docking protein FtsY [Desulfobacterales bacterium]